jgi:hypothetical protein
MRIPTGGVISERRELHGQGWKDCAYASGMMLARDAGVRFPLADLDREREALERSDHRRDETGAMLTDLVEAMTTRYHWAGHAVADLDQALLVPGRTLVVNGTYGHFPARLRRWDDFLAGHSIAVRVTASGLVVMDPMAPMGYPGDHATVSEVMRFAWGPAQSRIGAWGEAKPKAVPIYHIVVSGDTLIGIAAEHHRTLAQLLRYAANARYRANPGLIHVGDRVRVK